MSNSTKAYFAISGDMTAHIMNIISDEIGVMAEEVLSENNISKDEAFFFRKNDKTRTSREPDIKIHSFVPLHKNSKKPTYVIRGAYMTFDNNGFHYDVHVFFDSRGTYLMNHIEDADGPEPTVSISLTIGSHRPSAEVIKRFAEAVKANLGCEAYFIDNESSGDLIRL